MSELALQLIEKEIKERTGRLDLGRCGLKELPEELFELSWLEELKIGGRFYDALNLRWVKSKNNSGDNNIIGIEQQLGQLFKLRNLKILVLGKLGIKNLNFLNKCEFITHLYLSENNISDISILENLTNLNTLVLRSNSVHNITPIRFLSKLESLVLSVNKIKNIEILENLYFLKILDLRQNKITDINCLNRLESLNFLNLSRNPIYDYSDISNLINLKSLIIHQGMIRNISFLKKLKNLTTLNLNTNDISDISDLKNLDKLRSLDLRFNSITDISDLLPIIKKNVPVNLYEFRKNTIALNSNDLIIPPIEIVSKGNKAIINYFEEGSKFGTDRLYEAKLLIVGQGGVGKTSLSRRLIDPKSPMPKEKETTKGIDINEYHFKIAKNENFLINIWDFGGQEIYHSTHQFFLTKRSLYILVDDTRNDEKTLNDYSFNYWLQVIELLSNNSPLLIVQNEKGNRGKEIELQNMKSRFENLKENYKTNIAENRGMPELRRAIQFHIQNLPHIGLELPKHWISIRKELINVSQQKDFIQLDEYFYICVSYGIDNNDKALEMSSYFHDLGTFLHFQDDSILEEIIILNKTWATNAVYRVLDSESIKSQKGRFGNFELAAIWKERKFHRKKKELMALMEKFELCYELRDENEKTWLAPPLLPLEPPKHNWDFKDNLIYILDYDFMPKGLFSRFIVRLNRYVLEPEKAWRSGVFLYRKNTHAFIHEPYGKQEIIIRIKGANAKEFMTLIIEDFETMHIRFGNKLKLKKWVPCRCPQCLELETPHFYEYEDLRIRKEKGKKTVECKLSYDDVDVNGLLDGIFTKVIEEELEEVNPIEKEKSIKYGNKKIELFLASSNELADERKEVRLWIANENKRLFEKGIFLNLNIWEDFLNSMSETRLQDEYNKAILKSDIFISLFGTKAGGFSVEEFDVAHHNFKEKGQPKFIYTYFKDIQISTSSANLDHLITLRDFKQKISDLGHFYTNYTSTHDLLGQLKIQLDKIFEEMNLF